jgi:glycosyltransferase involved in cell wall biosynthesis
LNRLRRTHLTAAQELGLPDDCPVICAVGLEFRDYPTLIEAVRDLPVTVIIAAASPWSKRSDTTANQAIPENVIVQRFSQYKLRDVYAASRFMVMPLYDVPFQAGVTAILEAMAMEKAVICSRTSGQTDIVIESESGKSTLRLVIVPPIEDAEGMFEGIDTDPSREKVDRDL